jgi:hypothetical protein
MIFVNHITTSISNMKVNDVCSKIVLTFEDLI